MTSGTIAALLDASAKRPGRPLLQRVGGETLTVGEVARLTVAGARWLTEAGIRHGMTVAWQLPSTVPAALLMLSLARADVIQAPIVQICRHREVAAALDACRADVLVLDDSTAHNAPPNATVIALPTDFVERLGARAAVAADLRPAKPDAIRWIYFTSGATGKPKAVLHNDAALLAAARGFTTHLGLGDHAAEVGSITFPIGHIGGMVYLAAALIGGFPVVLIPRFDQADLPALLARHHVTVTGGSSVVYRMLVAAQVESGTRTRLVPTLRMLTGGGAPCPPELHRQVRAHLGIPVVHAYGMTEAAMICVGRIDDTEEQQINTSGSVTAGSQVRIAGNESHGSRTVLPAGEAGEIEVRGAILTAGYLDSDTWAAALSPDGWFRTGDLGFLRPDGRIVLTGRLKDIIIRKGENIAPDEIENELLAHPLVDEVAVLGQPDKLRGELVCAVVRRSRRHRDPTLSELTEFLDGRGLMKQKWPERLMVVDDFPLTGLGKIAKVQLAKQLYGGDS